MKGDVEGLPSREQPVGELEMLVASGAVDKNSAGDGANPSAAEGSEGPKKRVSRLSHPQQVNNAAAVDVGTPEQQSLRRILITIELEVLEVQQKILKTRSKANLRKTPTPREELPAGDQNHIEALILDMAATELATEIAKANKRLELTQRRLLESRQAVKWFKIHGEATKHVSGYDGYC